ncbi:RNA 2',3'-cyclic phosphodiesterase [Sediminicurvatus halobius]|uniref:RNA 2',3'-cyclic phosphodiesterase n=1 Tax=Sediminicurvatus halobius TaxID=2182432 RepID=A0A2U2MVS4_9GAMM|nr:RNA 2',3'-cyclic phosphodiesterase [Spiribacter halobius]PWG60961.1 RNA 2',3'-cyclic phosphodiesterase [Spiribacter halobius]UEX79539.1 RNA 2',3'-cyclic phosphodiesterase [Spiribacter halobius]
MPERLFFAVQPPPPSRAMLAGSVAAMGRPARRVHADDLHLTLAFLGEVGGTEAPSRAGDRAATQAPPFSLALDRFGLWRRRGIAYAAPSRVPSALLALHSALWSALEAEGWSRERRPFRPHLTLARGAVRAPRQVTVDPWRVEHLLLLASGPPPAPRYRVLASWALGGAAAE